MSNLTLDLNQLAIWNLRTMLQDTYRLAPNVQLESTCDQKRMKVLEPHLDELHHKQLNLSNSFHDIHFCYAHGGNKITYKHLAKQYGTIAYALKELLTFIKKHGNQPEITQYGAPLVSASSPGVYDMMKADFTFTLPVFVDRQAAIQAHYPTFNGWDEVTIDWDEVNAVYKAALKPVS